MEGKMSGQHIGMRQHVKDNMGTLSKTQHVKDKIYGTCKEQGKDNI